MHTKNVLATIGASIVYASALVVTPHIATREPPPYITDDTSHCTATDQGAVVPWSLCTYHMWFRQEYDGNACHSGRDALLNHDVVPMLWTCVDHGDGTTGMSFQTQMFQGSKINTQLGTVWPLIQFACPDY